MIRPLVQVLHRNRNARFWFCQLVGWAGYSVGTFLTITLVDGNLSWVHVGHIAMTAVLGIIATWPLRHLYQRTFNSPLGLRIFVAAGSVILFSAIWTILRILVFAWIVDEPPLWNEVNYWYFGSLFVFLSWTVLYYGIKYYDMLTTEHQMLIEEAASKKNEQMLRLHAEAAAHEAQIRMLHYQLAPHFLFNTLNAIYAMVRVGEVERAQQMIQLLGDFLRHALKQDSLENVSLKEEIDSLQLYLNIERVRFEDRLILRFDLAPETLNAKVPALLLQPIIENSMKYAISESEDGGTLSISSRVDGEKLVLEVSDTGPGIEPGPDAESRGIGLNNVMERLQILYGDDHEFSLGENAPTGLKVTISLPLHLTKAVTADSQKSEAQHIAEA